MNSIKDRNGTIYVGLKNINNKFCYFIAALQRLHSSTTLNELLQKQFNGVIDSVVSNNSSVKNNNVVDNNIKNFMSYLYIYSTITDDNIDEITNKLSHIRFDKWLSTEYQNGGDPDVVMKYLYLPMIYKIADNETFKTILEELKFKIIQVNSIFKQQDFNITSNSKFNNTLFETFQKMYNELKDYVFKNDKNFNCTYVYVYLKNVDNNINEFGGHAINLIRANDDIYVIDDNINIRKWDNYFLNIRDSLYNFEFKDVDDSTVEIMQHNVNFDVNKRIYRVIVTPKQSNVLFGGTTVDENLINEKYEPIINLINKSLLGILLLLLVIIFVLIIVILMRYKQNRDTINSLLAKIDKTNQKINELKPTSSFELLREPGVNNNVNNDMNAVNNTNSSANNNVNNNKVTINDVTSGLNKYRFNALSIKK